MRPTKEIREKIKAMQHEAFRLYLTGDAGRTQKARELTAEASRLLYETWKKPRPGIAIEEAVKRIERELSGRWWWRCGDCKVSSDATIGMDDPVSDAWHERDVRFDKGFDVDLRHTPTRTYTCAEALLVALELAKAAVAEMGGEKPEKPAKGGKRP